MSEDKTEFHPDGVCRIKEEYIITDHVRSLAVEHISDKDKEDFHEKNDGSKRQKLENGKAKKLKGQNKKRHQRFTEEPDQCFCRNVLEKGVCEQAKCAYLHDPVRYLQVKPADIGDTCYIYSVRGFCPRSLTCRFASSHISEEGKNLTEESLKEKWDSDPARQTRNYLQRDVQKALWKKKYDFGKSTSVVRRTEARLRRQREEDGRAGETESSPVEGDGSAQGAVDSRTEARLRRQREEDGRPGETESCPEERSGASLGAVDDSDVIRLRPQEKKKIDWRGKLYLSPLTTVGNLPFRRLCVEYGADVTCSEMALSQSILQGTREWALLRRHPTERLFGVQICGNNAMLMSKCGQLLEETTEIDFIDINLGCPIDQLYEQGCGSGLLRRRNVLAGVVHSLGSLLSLPLTVKTRMGVSSAQPLAHKYMPLFRDAGVSLVTVHGRSREQRYTKNADWAYIEECAKEASPMAVFGNGDILSYEDYETHLEEHPCISGVMLGRGALIKPWIFTEIKERKHMDVSSQERLEMLRKFVNYGLEHWGSDTRGVETCRRFLLEWLSFLHRYVPVGLLERPPQRINQRPPYYQARDELETLMASSNCSDWVTISKMLLGPVPEGFTFLPKHKANAWK